MDKIELKKIQDITNSIPNNWEQLKYSTYTKVIDMLVEEDNAHTDEDDRLFSGVERSYKLLSILTGEPFEYFNKMSYQYTAPMLERVTFIHNLPEFKDYKGDIKILKVDEVPYNTYLEFMSLAKDYHKNMAKIVSLFIQKEVKEDGKAVRDNRGKKIYENYTEDEVNNLSVAEVYSIFFMQTKQLKKYLNTSKKQLILTLLKLTAKKLIKTLIQAFKGKFRPKGSK